MMNTETTAPKQGEAPSGTAPKKRGHGPGRPFEKGKSGNPNGRPKGALTRRSREIAERVMSTDDLTPLEILLAGMKVAYEAGDWDNVHKFASAAAPYCHSKLQAIEHGGVGDNKIVVNIVRFSDVDYSDCLSGSATAMPTTSANAS